MDFAQCLFAALVERGESMPIIVYPQRGWGQQFVFPALRHKATGGMVYLSFHKDLGGVNGLTVEVEDRPLGRVQHLATGSPEPLVRLFMDSLWPHVREDVCRLVESASVVPPDSAQLWCVFPGGAVEVTPNE